MLNLMCGEIRYPSGTCLLYTSLGGQNPFTYFAPVAENIKIAPLSAYDQGCVELIQNSFSDYFQGNVDFDKAKANFETAIKERCV